MRSRQHLMMRQVASVPKVSRVRLQALRLFLAHRDHMPTTQVTIFLMPHSLKAVSSGNQARSLGMSDMSGWLSLRIWFCQSSSLQCRVCVCCSFSFALLIQFLFNAVIFVLLAAAFQHHVPLVLCRLSPCWLPPRRVTVALRAPIVADLLQAPPRSLATARRFCDSLLGFLSSVFFLDAFRGIFVLPDRSICLALSHSMVVQLPARLALFVLLAWRNPAVVPSERKSYSSLLREICPIICVF